MSADVAYLDTSAAVKLLMTEPESSALRRWLRRRPERASAALLRVELVRVVRRAGVPRLIPETRKLLAGIHLIRAEVAADPDDRAKGLMFRPRLGANQGMVFLFDAPAVQCMWMKNTLIPLSVAFIGDDGRVLNIAEMQPQTETSHCAAKPARYALEMNLGWFAKHGINAGAKITGLPKPR